MKIRRIFWKLFFGFWLGNAAMLAAVTVFIITSVETSHMKERHRQMNETIASTIIEEYESTTKIRANIWKNFFRHNRQFRDFKNHFAMRILDQDNQEIINIRFHKKRKSMTPIVFTLQSDAGNNYRVETYKRRPPPFLQDALRRVNILQIIAVLFSSAFVAGILSWHLSRPLKALRQFSKSYSGGSSDVDIEVQLLARGDEIGDLARELQAMGTRVHQNFSSQKELLHYVSHELRAPLARLQTVAGLTEQRFPDTQDFIGKIHQECQNINLLIENILRYSRLEHVALSKSQIKPEELIKEVVTTVSSSYPKNEIIQVYDPDFTKMSVNIDEERIFHALENVLQNACKYGDQNEGIRIHGLRNEASMMVTIENKGDSLPSEELSQIFEPFYRAGNTMHTEGHGLGLSIAKRAIVQHGGSIYAENIAPGGVRIVITLPISLTVP